MSPCKIHSCSHTCALSFTEVLPPCPDFLKGFDFSYRYIQWGAPPVINPVGSVFPKSTLWSPSHSLSLLVTSQSSTTYNLSSPAPGDWYIAAHLPEDDGRIEQKVCVHFRFYIFFTF